MSAETVAIVVSAIAIGIAAFSVWKAYEAGTPITGELVQSTLAVATTEAQELAAAALTAAQAAEQLYRTGKIERSDRLDYAFKYVEKFFPGMDQERILTAIEASVMIVNTVVSGFPKQVGASSENAKIIGS